MFTEITKHKGELIYSMVWGNFAPMDIHCKRRLETYIKDKCAGALKSHSVDITVRVEPSIEKILIDVKCASIMLASIAQDPDVRRVVNRLEDLCRNYFNMRLSTVRLQNSLLTKRSLHYDVPTREFRSWMAQPL